MSFVVHADGHVDGLESRDPKSPPVLVKAVAEWLLGCLFKPRLENGKAVDARTVQRFQFNGTPPFASEEQLASDAGSPTQTAQR